MKVRQILTSVLAMSLIASTLVSCGKKTSMLPMQPQIGDPSLLSTPVTQTPVQGFGSISGRLVDNYGKGVHNATVTLVEAPYIIGRTNQGNFLLANVPSGRHTLKFTLGNRECTASVTVMPNTQSYPDQNPVQFIPTNMMGGIASSMGGIGTPNNKVASFKVDQSTVYDWQARGIAVSGGSIYITVADTTGLIKAGSVIKINSSDGKNYKDIGSKWLGLSHPISKDVNGLTVMGGSIIAVDDNNTYLVDTNGGVKKVQGTGGKDVASTGSNVYISGNGSLLKTDTSIQASSPLASIISSAGIGADNLGNVYVISGNSIKKVSTGNSVSSYDQFMGSSNNFDSMGQDIIMGLVAPIDVAVDNRNGDIYVLDGTEIKRFDQQGTLLVSFPSQAKKPVSIAIDEQGNVYVADAGSSSKDSYIIKFGASSDNLGTSYNSNSNYYNNNSNYNSNYGYNSSYDTNYNSGYNSNYGYTNTYPQTGGYTPQDSYGTYTRSSY